MINNRRMLWIRMRKARRKAYINIRIGSVIHNVTYKDCRKCAENQLNWHTSDNQRACLQHMQQTRQLVAKRREYTLTFRLISFRLTQHKQWRSTLVTVPKMGKTHHISNMTVWDKMAIFETTAKNSVLGRWVPGTDLKYEKKMKKFDLVTNFVPQS